MNFPAGKWNVLDFTLSGESPELKKVMAAFRWFRWYFTGRFQAWSWCAVRERRTNIILAQKSCKLLPFCDFNAEIVLFIQTPKLPLKGSKRGIFPSPVGQNGALFCMSKERLDSMGTTESHSQLLTRYNILHTAKKAKRFSIFFIKKTDLLF